MIKRIEYIFIVKNNIKKTLLGLLAKSLCNYYYYFRIEKVMSFIFDDLFIHSYFIYIFFDLL